MARKKENVAGKVALSAGIAAAAALVLGWLTAPKSGKQTRKALKAKAATSYKAAEKELKKLHTELAGTIDKAVASTKNKKEVKDALAKAETARQKAREVLSALHEGDSDDAELQKVISEATLAVKNLKTYLKK